MHSTLEDLERQIDEAKYFKPPASRLHVPTNGDKYTLNVTRKLNMYKLSSTVTIQSSPKLTCLHVSFISQAFVAEQATWPIIKDDICLAIGDFFKTGKILKEVNVTSLSLVPKLTVPNSVSDFRPIACCSVIYKCISKIMCSKLRQILQAIISPTQGAFVACRSILHNVLICQDIIKLYNRGNSRPSCMMKLDLKKAYDTVE
ncbi:uncharacterized protein [Spinacia oleracea]|uniref:Reverse transcriptase domain-containing protein n=1 Tax=Spinacia oleracea TaxID=3562 RepID=A0ABM3RQX9_SPIOL|nr:uncharacterized protein LOC130471752 [Spinacia oleracea]